MCARLLILWREGRKGGSLVGARLKLLSYWPPLVISSVMIFPFLQLKKRINKRGYSTAFSENNDGTKQ